MKLVEGKGWEDFGFMLVRMDYTDEERWKRFKKKFYVLLDKEMDDSIASKPQERVQSLKDKALIQIMDDDTVNGTGVLGVAKLFSYLLFKFGTDSYNPELFRCLKRMEWSSLDWIRRCASWSTQSASLLSSILGYQTILNHSSKL